MLQDKNTFEPEPTGLGYEPSYTPQQATNLLYAGEQFDVDAQQYYLRARYYDPLNGRFNRVDPYSGDNQDPQSLHKYLYCHANPVNGIDPSGMSFLTSVVSAIQTVAFMTMNLLVRLAPVISLVRTLAFSVMVVSAIELVLEQAGFVPQLGYTEEMLVISAIIFTGLFILCEFIESFRGIVEPVSGSSSGQIISGKTANLRSPVSDPPYKPNSLAAEGKIAQNTDMVRVYKPGTTQPAGNWTMPRSEVRGLSPSQIQNKFSTPFTPTHYSEVNATGIKARVGIANGLYGFDGGGTQIELLETGADFVNSAPIPSNGIQ